MPQRSSLYFTLATDAGDLDVLGEVTGLGGYDVVERYSDTLSLYGMAVKVLGLDGLARAKAAAGRRQREQCSCQEPGRAVATESGA